MGSQGPSSILASSQGFEAYTCSLQPYSYSLCNLLFSSCGLDPGQEVGRGLLGSQMAFIEALTGWYSFQEHLDRLGAVTIGVGMVLGCSMPYDNQQ